MKARSPIHIILLATFPVLSLAATNISKIWLPDLARPLLIVLAIASLLFIFLMFFTRNKEKAGLIGSYTILLFFSYGRLYSLSSQAFKQLNWRFVSSEIFFFGWIIVLILGIYFIAKIKKHLSTTTSLINTISIVLITITLTTIATREWKIASIIVPIPASSKYLHNTPSINTRPDIYYIILDAYGSSKILQSVFSYDNQRFIDYLTNKGFYVASSSLTNYPCTFLSLASSLNMEYLDDLTKLVGRDSNDEGIPLKMIQNNEVSKFLQTIGYKYVQVGSSWGPTDYSFTADKNVYCGWTTEFIEILLWTTPLEILDRHLDFSLNHLRSQRLTCFKELCQAAGLEGPKFVFAHILLPHPPYLFHANGDPVLGKEVYNIHNMEEYKKLHLQLYPEHAMFLETQLKEVVDTILAESKSPPIIILQGDHGPEWYAGRNDAYYIKVLCAIRFPIFNAYYLPYGGKELLYKSISPVNSFRLILSHYFHVPYPLLPDKQIFSSYQRPYIFQNTTGLFHLENKSVVSSN